MQENADAALKKLAAHLIAGKSSRNKSGATVVYFGEYGHRLEAQLEAAKLKAQGKIMSYYVISSRNLVQPVNSLKKTEEDVSGRNVPASLETKEMQSKAEAEGATVIQPAPVSQPPPAETVSSKTDEKPAETVSSKTAEDPEATSLASEKTVISEPSGAPKTLVTPSPSAQTNSSLSAVDILSVYKLAIENDPQFRGADQEQQALRESLSQAYARLMPVIEGSIAYGVINQNIKKSSNTVFAMGKSEYDSGTYTLKGTLPIFKWSLFSEVSQAKNLQKRADVDLESAKQELMLRVTQAYFTALASKESLAFANAEKKDIEVLHERANVKYKSGLTKITEVYDARARLASANAQVIKAESDYRDALQALQEICKTGFTDLKNLPETLAMEMPVPDDAGHWVNMGLDQNLKLKIQKFDSEVARIEVDRQRAAHYPSLDVVGRYYEQDTGGSLFGGGSVVDTWDVMLEVNVPIFSGGLIYSKTKEAKMKYAATTENVERQRRAVIRQVNSTYDGIKTAKSRAEALAKSIESQANVLEAKEQGYRSGIYTSLAVLDASRDLYLSRRDYAQSRYDYVFGTLRFKQAMGTLSDADLIIVNNWLR